MVLIALDVAVCICTLCMLIWVHNRRSAGNSTRLRYPPGPPGLPLFGNLRDLPKDYPWLTYSQWSQKYDSDIVRLNIFGMNIIVINDMDAAIDLFEKRSSFYSDRPQTIMLNELVGCGWGVAFRSYGSAWRDTRKAFHLEFNPNAVTRFRPIESAATHDLLHRLLEDPEDFIEHVRHLAGSTIMQIAYGIEVKSKHDPYIEIGEAAVQVMSVTGSAGAYLVDVLPFLRHIPSWFPGAQFQRDAKVWSIPISGILNKPYDVVKQHLASGHANESVATSLLDAMGKNAKDPAYMEDIIKSTLGSMYAGGADTTVSSLGSFFLAMVLYPDVQRKAQEEIDRVVGSGRLPKYEDHSSLPYIEAIVKEILRWNPVLPLSVPHRVTTDDVYKHYFIPAGSLIVGNSWAILHNEKDYPDPMVFNPDRFMKAGKLNREVRDPSTVAFGFGRRICPGRFLAKESTWLAVACILATFHISKAMDANGQPITPDGEYIRGLVCHPKPFPCSIRPRSKEQESLIMAASAH